MFPYDSTASRGSRFTAEFVPTGQGAGRFDVADVTPVWYLAESPLHAVAEILQGLRNQQLDAADLIRFGHPLALVAGTVRITGKSGKSRSVPDLCDPAMLKRYGIRPDELASSDFSRTQAVAHRLYEAGCAGFRWWSALSGDWHTIVLFQTVLRRGELKFDAPEVLTVHSSSIAEAAKHLSIAISAGPQDYVAGHIQKTEKTLSQKTPKQPEDTETAELRELIYLNYG